MNPDLNRFLNKLPSRTLFCLLCITVLLTAVHYLADLLPDTQRISLKPLVNLSKEGNLPNMFAECLWDLSALAAYVCFLTERFTNSKTSRVWLFIAAALIFAAIDETCTIHERLPDLWNYLRAESFKLPDWAGESNMLWQTLYAPLALLFFVATIRLLFSRTCKSSPVRPAIVAATACFAVAVGCECIADSPLLTGQLYEIPFFRYSRILFSGEEVLEDVGAIFMLFAFMKYATSLAVRHRMERNLAETPPSLVSNRS